jgi:hypothetical protein
MLCYDVAIHNISVAILNVFAVEGNNIYKAQFLG